MNKDEKGLVSDVIREIPNVAIALFEKRYDLVDKQIEILQKEIEGFDRVMLTMFEKGIQVFNPLIQREILNGHAKKAKK